MPAGMLGKHSVCYSWKRVVYVPLKVMLLHGLYSSAYHPSSVCHLKCVSGDIRHSSWFFFFFLDLHHRHKLDNLRNTVDKETEEKNK